MTAPGSAGPSARCGTCGSPNESLDQFCGECGARMAGTAAPSARAVATAPSPRTRPWLIRSLMVAAAATAGVAIFLVVLSRPALVVENRLIEPIALVVGNAERRIAPDNTGHVVLARGQPVAVPWFLVRPVGPDGQPMGEDMQLVIEAESPRGKVRRTVDSRSAGTAYFAPLITNHTDQPLRILVNAGLAGAVDCRCAVRPGATRARIGYYRLFANSTVRARDPAGRTATFRDLGPQADPRSGRVGLRFNAGDLRAGGGR